MTNNKRIFWFLLTVFILLLIPLVGMQFTTEINWSPLDFVVMGGLLLGTAFFLALVVGALTSAISLLEDEGFEVFLPSALPCNDAAISLGQVAELAALVRDIVGFAGEIEYDASKPDGTPRKLVDTSKINALGWKASTGLRAGVEATYAWFLDNVNDLRGTV